jgi:hypothetical protein
LSTSRLLHLLHVRGERPRKRADELAPPQGPSHRGPHPSTLPNESRGSRRFQKSRQAVHLGSLSKALPVMSLSRNNANVSAEYDERDLEM